MKPRRVCSCLPFIFLSVTAVVAADPAGPLRVVPVNAVAQENAGIPFPDSLIASISSDGKLQVQAIDLASLFKQASLLDFEEDLASLKFVLVSEDGSTQEATTNENGLAEFDDVVSGWAALIVADASKQKHGAIPVFAQASDVADPMPLTYPVMTVSAQTVLQNIRGYVGDADGPSVAFSEPKSYPPVPRNFYQVRLQPDSSLLGRVIVPLRADGKGWGDLGNINITIFQGGREIARTGPDGDGRFSVAAMKPGVYGVIAAGRSGYAAYAFEVLPNEATAKTVSFRKLETGDELTTVLVPPSMLPDTVDAIEDSYGQTSTPPPGTPQTPTGTPQSTSGGGGGGGGGSGNGLGALAGLAAAAAALAGDDGIASPAAP